MEVSMALLLAMVYDDQQTAETALTEAKALESYGYLTILDQTLVRKSDSGKVEMDEKKHPVGRGAIVGGVVGAIFGTAMLMPIAGAAAGAAVGAVIGHGNKGGADDFKDFCQQVAQDLPAGGAAVVLLGSTEGRERVIHDLGKTGGRLYTHDLHDDEVAAIQKEIDRAAAEG
jgi:uncharacterized membrane protein